MVATSKKEADRWDRVLDAAANLADLIDSSGIKIDEYDLEELTIFLAANGAVVRDLFKTLKRRWPPE
jgi:dsDNA-binding SOS-regulon protein